MALWFLRGLRRGIATTRYPHPGWPEGDRWARKLPSPPSFCDGLLTSELADRLVEACVSGALWREGNVLRIDVGSCTGCGRCVEDGEGATTPSGLFELARRDRAALVCSVPIATQENEATGSAGPKLSGPHPDYNGRDAGERDAGERDDDSGFEARPCASKEEQAVARELSRRAGALFGRSLFVRTVDTGSCAACESEIRLLVAPHYDLHRLGLFFTPAPRHADLLLVTGPAVRAADTLALATYQATPDPKIVVAVGACALGGVYEEDEVVHGSVDSVLPVDVYIPGCPPSPLALLQGLLVAVGRLEEKALNLLAEPEEEPR